MTVVDSTGVFALKKTRVLGPRGVVISSDNRVFSDFTYVDKADGFNNHDVFRRRRFPVPVNLSGWYATICYPSSFSYFHWIVETLPRIRLISDFLDALDGVFVPSRLEPAMKESLNYFGVKDSQVIELDFRSHFKPENLLVPKYCAGLNIPDRLSRYYRMNVLAGRTRREAHRRLYISRKDATKRRVQNELEVWSLLKSEGFENIELKGMGFKRQVELFDDAEIIVGAHGAGLSNIVFCRQSTKLLELIPSKDIPPHVYYSLAVSSGVEYWFLAGHTNPSLTMLDKIHLDFEIDINQLDSLLHVVSFPRRKSRGIRMVFCSNVQN